MGRGLVRVSGSLLAIGALAVWLWPGSAQAIVCEDAQGSCEVTVDGTMEMGSCRCADCSPAVGFGGGGAEPLPDPTEEYCLEILAIECTGAPVTDAADVCSPEALALCQGGLVEHYMTCGAPTNRDEELCITVACCQEADDIGLQALTEYWECVSGYDDCAQAQEACWSGEGETGGGGGDGDGDGDANGDGDGDASEDAGCGCSTTPDAAPLSLGLFSLLLLRRRR